MKIVTNGQNVKVHYKGTFSNGEVFDDSRMRGQPMSVSIGDGKLLKAFESAIVGMSVGQTKTVSLKPSDAYGPRYEEAVVTIPKVGFPEDFIFRTGTPVIGRGPNGEKSMATIVSHTDSEVTLDHNHPLAGKDVNFEIELVEIEERKQLSNYTVKELRAFAKEKGIKGFSTMKKAELVESLNS